MKTDKNSQTTTQSGTLPQPEQAFPDNSKAAPQPKRVRISYERWLEVYRPIQNPHEADSPFGGTMFETYGEDFAFVSTQPESHVWTLLDDGDRRMFICEGLHFIDRSGYFVTEVPAPDKKLFMIKIS